jgi:hypothetical protein
MGVAAGGVVDVGVDPAVEDLVELRVELWSPEHAPADMVPGEGRQMSEVEDERMAQGDRLLEHRVRGDDGEDSIRPLPHGLKSLVELEEQFGLHGGGAIVSGKIAILNRESR